MKKKSSKDERKSSLYSPNKNKYKSLHYSNKSSALFQICRVIVCGTFSHSCSNRMLHITSFTLNSYHINSISKWLRHMYSIMAQQYQIPGLMAIIFSQFIFVLFLPFHILCFYDIHFGAIFHVYIFYVACTSNSIERKKS